MQKVCILRTKTIIFVVFSQVYAKNSQTDKKTKKIS